MKSETAILGLLMAATVMASAHADVRAVDDSGAAVVLAMPARRIASLAPHATELLFAAGAGGQIVATVAYADHPDAARGIPRVGDTNRVDIERLIALRPDLAVVWRDGTPEHHIARIRRAGIPVYQDRPRRLSDVASSIERLGRLAGTDQVAGQAAGAFRTRLEALQRGYAGRSAVTVFFQVWKNPLLTLSGDHVIDDALRLCGGRNIFGDDRLLVPTVDIESVVKRDPDAIVVSSSRAEGRESLSVWRALPHLRATARGNLVLLDSPALARPSPGMLEGVEQLCARLDEVRTKTIR
jgi:iron complex transport system substrate-binding protein